MDPIHYRISKNFKMTEPEDIAKREEEKLKHPDVVFTGKSIEEERIGKTTINDLRDQIIEAAVHMCDCEEGDKEAQMVIRETVEAYHAALRKQARKEW